VLEKEERIFPKEGILVSLVESTGRRFETRWAFLGNSKFKREKESRLEPSSTTVEVFTVTLKAFKLPFRQDARPPFPWRLTVEGVSNATHH
jgi:hypothetical protein